MEWRKQVNKERKNQLTESMNELPQRDSSDMKRSRTHYFENARLRNTEIKSGFEMADSLDDDINIRKRSHIMFNQRSQNFLTQSNVGLLKRKDSDQIDTYWKDRAELLIYEKKKWIQERKEMRAKMSQLQDKVEMMEIKNKHLHSMINRFGNFDQIQFEFPTPKNAISSSNQNIPKVDDLSDEINQEYMFNNIKIDQRKLHGVESNNDQTIIASKLLLDDRDLLIQQTQYKNRHMSSNEREGHDITNTEMDTSANFGPASVTGMSKSIPQTQNIEIRMKNRLQNYSHHGSTIYEDENEYVSSPYKQPNRKQGLKGP